MLQSSLKTISILVITYNHEKYLAQALNGILEQTVNAKLEVIIGDDGSTDGTLNIAHSYQQKHPELIKILSAPKNTGHTRNYERAWKEAKGDYIAHCDGDDYWIDPLKLSRQLDFLENNPQYSCCAHKIWAISEDDNSKHGPLPRTDMSSFDTQALLEACFPHNCSLLFRNRIFSTLPDFFFNLTGHDWCIDLLNSLHGPIKILPEIMGVWRMRSKGLWGGRQSSFHLEHNIYFLTQIKAYLPQKNHKDIRKNLNRNYFLLSIEYLNEGNTSKANECLSKLFNSNSLFIIPTRKLLSLWGQLKFPWLYQSMRNLRNHTLGEPPRS